MIYNKRSKPISLVIMESLARRTTLSKKDTHYLNSLQKGFEGELAFDRMAAKLGAGCTVINDLLLQPKMSNAFQIDSLVLIGQTVYLYEIKNYSGEYCYGPEMLLKKPDFEVSNPLIQMQSSKNKLKIFLRELGYTLKVKAYVVYVHPEFTLFHAPENEAILLPTQLKSHFAKLNKETELLAESAHRFVETLMLYKIESTPFVEDIPKYDFNTLKKGVRCESCGSFDLVNYRQNYQCYDCSYKNTFHSAILNTIKEYQQLFPDSKLSTRIIYRWCNETASKNRIKTALNSLCRQ
ncbi:nuclease-related domain-containing protein [Carnobacterium funditum]|uniref:nuclease-related domain-containing protein n=1 Tax=Carnobacterium funditum TaxID=2752 RepID=UPI0005592400|nr:nuclease-related domain-containing protein [Carnobacterium funditum]